jgi:hypothetical protein
VGGGPPPGGSQCSAVYDRARNSHKFKLAHWHSATVIARCGTGTVGLPGPVRAADRPERPHSGSGRRRPPECRSGFPVTASASEREKIHPSVTVSGG